MDKVEQGGAGLQYSEERTVYLTYDEASYEITEEERNYNKETFALAFEKNIFISYDGIFYYLISGNDYELRFSSGVFHEGTLVDVSIYLHKDGEAAFVLTPIQTGGCSATSDFNNDFNNDF